MVAFEKDGGNSEEHCLKMLRTWIEEEGEKATFPALINALMGVQGLKPIVTWLKDGGDEQELLEPRGEKRSKDHDGGEEKKKKMKTESA